MKKSFKLQCQERRERIAEEVASSEACWDIVYRYLAGHICWADADAEFDRLKDIAERIIDGPSVPDDPQAKEGTYDKDDEPRLA